MSQEFQMMIETPVVKSYKNNTLTHYKTKNVTKAP